MSLPTTDNITGRPLSCQPCSAITTEQSQKLIQTMLTMTIGTICYLRGLFTESCFIDQRFVPAKFEPNYIATNTGKDHILNKDSDSLRVKTLVRGKSKRVDTLLNWTEKGCFEAIKKEYLRSMTIGVFSDKTKPEILKECYTLWFTYTKDGSIGFDISNDNNSDMKIVTHLSSRQTLQSIIKRLIILTQSMDPLDFTKKKYLSMRLLFNDSCPVDYQPSYFKDASTKKPFFVRSNVNGIVGDRFGIGEIKTGKHGVCLNVFTESLNTNEENSIELDPFDFPIVPADVCVTEKQEAKGTSTKNATLNLQELNVPENIASLEDSTSQVTKELRTFINSTTLSSTTNQSIPATQFTETQMIQLNYSLNCECGSMLSLKNSETLKCVSCSQSKHAFCYGIDFHLSKINGLTKTQKNQFNCYTCKLSKLGVDEREKENIRQGLKPLTNSRKLFLIFRELKGLIPNSYLSLLNLAGFSDTNLAAIDNSFTLSKTLRLFIEKGLLYLTESPLYNQNGSITKGSGKFEMSKGDIDLSGIKDLERVHEMMELIGSSTILTFGLTFTPWMKHSFPKKVSEMKAKAAEFKKILFNELRNRKDGIFEESFESVIEIIDNIFKPQSSSSKNYNITACVSSSLSARQDDTTRNNVKEQDFSSVDIVDSTQDSIFPPLSILPEHNTEDVVLVESILNHTPNPSFHVSPKIGSEGNIMKRKRSHDSDNANNVNYINDEDDDPIVDSMQDAQDQVMNQLILSSQPILNSYGVTRRENRMHILKIQVDDEEKEDVEDEKMPSRKIRKISELVKGTRCAFINAGVGSASSSVYTSSEE